MDLGTSIQRLKVLVERLRHQEILAPEPDALENLVEAFCIIEELDIPQLVGSDDFAYMTADGQEIEA